MYRPSARATCEPYCTHHRWMLRQCMCILTSAEAIDHVLHCCSTAGPLKSCGPRHSQLMCLHRHCCSIDMPEVTCGLLNMSSFPVIAFRITAQPAALTTWHPASSAGPLMRPGTPATNQIHVLGKLLFDLLWDCMKHELAAILSRGDHNLMQLPSHQSCRPLCPRW